jgi:peroxin-2
LLLLRGRSVLERLLRARLVYVQPSAARAISFEYLNRQLVWSELRWLLAPLLPRSAGACTGASRALAAEPAGQRLVHCVCCLCPWPCCSELLLFLLPLVNAKAIKHAVRSYLPRLPMLGGPGARGGGTQQQAGQSSATEQRQQPCGICSTADVLTPYAAVPCGHAFCYYCLRSNCLADPQFACPLCLRRVAAMQQLGGAAGVGPDSAEAAAADGGRVDGQPRRLEKSELSLAGWLAGLSEAAEPSR